MTKLQQVYNSEKTLKAGGSELVDTKILDLMELGEFFFEKKFVNESEFSETWNAFFDATQKDFLNITPYNLKFMLPFLTKLEKYNELLYVALLYVELDPDEWESREAFGYAYLLIDEYELAEVQLVEAYRLARLIMHNPTVLRPYPQAYVENVWLRSILILCAQAECKLELEHSHEALVLLMRAKVMQVECKYPVPHEVSNRIQELRTEALDEIRSLEQ